MRKQPGIDDGDFSVSSDASSDARIRAVRGLAGVSVAAWIILGLIHTGVVLSRPGTGWLLRREPGAERAIGVPRLHEDASRLVSRALDLLDSAGPGAGEVWIVRSGLLEEDTWQYVQMQLANLAYPRVIRVAPVGSLSMQSFEYALTFDGDSPGTGWEEVATLDVATLYRPSPR